MYCIVSIISTNIVLCVFSIRGEEEMADSDYLLVKGEDVGEREVGREWK